MEATKREREGYGGLHALDGGGGSQLAFISANKPLATTLTLPGNMTPQFSCEAHRVRTPPQRLSSATTSRNCNRKYENNPYSTRTSYCKTAQRENFARTRTRTRGVLEIIL
jgi:hypothetical protein